MKDYCKTEVLYELVDYLDDEGIDEHTMLRFLIDDMTSEEGIEKMKKLAKECDIDLEDFWADIELKEEERE